MVTPRRVLLVGDSSQLLIALKALIRTAPDLDVLGDPVAAEQALARAQVGQPDVVLLAMPLDAVCLALVRELAGLPRPPHLLVLTNELDEIEMSALVDAGVASYLPLGTAPADVLSSLLTSPPTKSHEYVK